MTNQELFEQAVAGNWIAESFDPRDASDGVGKFYLSGSGKGYSTFSDSIDDGQVVFYAAFDDDCNREAGYGIFNADDMSITPVETTATLRNDQYVDGDVAPVPFPNGGTITGTFNAVAFNAIWAHIWDKNNPHEVNAEQVEQDNENLLGDNVQDALDNLSGIIAEWDNAIKSTAQNYVQELPPPNPQVGDMWTDVGVTGEQYVWEGDYWVSVTGGGLGVDLDDLDSYSSKVTTDVVEDDQLYDIPLERVISSATGKGEWVAGGDGSGAVFVPEAPDDGLQYGRQSGTWTEIDAGGVWDADGINGPDGGGIGHYYHLSNAPNTNIFETAIGSDEVKMLNMQSVASALYTDLDGNPILTDYVRKDENNAIYEGDFRLTWDDSNNEQYPFLGSIGYSGTNPDPDSPGGAFLFASGTRGTVTIGRDGDMELHGPSEIKGVPDNSGNLPWITEFSYVQAADFRDADGNPILTGYSTETYVDEAIAAIPDFTESDPTVPAHVKSITSANVGNWNTAHGWGNHASAGYAGSAALDAKLDKGSANIINTKGFTTMSTYGFNGVEYFMVPCNENGSFDNTVGIGHTSFVLPVIHSKMFYKNGSPMLAAVDLIDTFETIKSAITDETTVEGLRSSVVSGLDAVIAKLQAMEDKAEEEGHKA